jgi:hypothetical protein
MKLPIERAQLPAQLRSPIVASTLRWFRGAYGEEALLKASAMLPWQEQAALTKSIPLVGWYSVISFERILTALYQEANQRAPLTQEEFDSRGLSEAGSAAIQTLYRFISSLIPPELLLPQLALIFNRIYNQATLTVLENKRGYARFLIIGSREMYPLAERSGRIASLHILRDAGAKDASYRKLREETNQDNFLLESELYYT